MDNKYLYNIVNHVCPKLFHIEDFRTKAHSKYSVNVSHFSLMREVFLKPDYKQMGVFGDILRSLLVCIRMLDFEFSF